jgi:hypothetical protein
MLPVVFDMRHLALNLVFGVLQLQRPGYKTLAPACWPDCCLLCWLAACSGLATRA